MSFNQPTKLIATGTGTITRLNRKDIEPVLMPGQKVRVQEGQQYAIYQVPRYDAPEVLPLVPVNLASFSSPLSALRDSGSQTTIPHSMTEWDVVSPALAQYRLVPLTPGVQFTVKQPAVVGKFVNKDGVIKLDWSQTYTDMMTGNFGMIPEVWTFGDQTTIQVEALNMDMNATKARATIGAYGVRYPLQYMETRELPSGEIIYRDVDGRDKIVQAVMTVNVGQTQGR